MPKDLQFGHKIKRIKAPSLFLSCRLSFFVLCLFATLNFVILRLNINFALVCMVKSPQEHAQTQKENLTSYITNSTNDGREVTSKDLELIQFNHESSTDHVDDGSFCQASEILTNSTDQDDTMFYEGVFEWDKTTQGNILGSFYYGYIFTNIIGGWVSDKLGGRKSFIASIAVLSLLTLLNPLASLQGPLYLFIVRFLQGVSQGAGMPLMNILSARWAGHSERAFLLGVAYGGFTIAAFITNPVCAFICTNFGWSYIFYITGGLGIVWCLVSYFLIYDWPEEHPRISKEELEFLQKNRAIHPLAQNTNKKIIIPWKSILLSGPLNTLYFVHFCTLWGFVTLNMYIPQYFKEILKMDIATNGTLSSIPFLGMLILHWLTGSIFDSMRRRNFCSVTNLRKGFNTFGLSFFTLSLCLISLIPCTDNTLEIILIFTLTSFWEVAIVGGYIFSIFELAPRFAGLLTGISNTFGVIPGFLCPTLVGYLTQNGKPEEWYLVFYIAAALGGLGALVYLIFGSSELQPWADIQSETKVAEMQVLQQKLIPEDRNQNPLANQEQVNS